MTTTSTTAPRFLGYATTGTCARCARDLGCTYLVEVDGETLTLGRRCAARTMGWATSALEMAAKAAAFRAAKIERRRAEGFTMDDARAIARECVTDDAEATAAALYAEVWG